MTFSSTIIATGVMGDKRYAFGTWINPTGTSGGDISTGLSSVEVCMLSNNAASLPAQQPAVTNETFPLASGNVTIVCVAGATEAQAGFWFAIGY